MTKISDKWTTLSTPAIRMLNLSIVDKVLLKLKLDDAYGAYTQNLC